MFGGHHDGDTIRAGPMHGEPYRGHITFFRILVAVDDGDGDGIVLVRDLHQNVVCAADGIRLLPAREMLKRSTLYQFRGRGQEQSKNLYTSKSVTLSPPLNHDFLDEKFVKGEG